MSDLLQALKRLLGRDAESTRSNPRLASELRAIVALAEHESSAEKFSSAGVNAIAAERQRQVDVEGFDADHDNGSNDCGELARAAACYANPIFLNMGDDDDLMPLGWPESWDTNWWKPCEPNLSGERRRDLVKAGALIAAEIDRLDRLNYQGDETP